MDFNKHGEERRTADEYRALADLHRQACRNQWKIFFKCGFFTLAAFVAIIVMAIAWYANNSRVNIENINVSAADASFELRSYGTNEIHSDIISNFFKNVAMNNDNSSPYTTSSALNNINWLMSDTSNIGNYSEEAVDFSVTDRKDYAIEPGSGGELTFYIVPKNSGTQTFNFNLTVSPYAATVDESTREITSITEVGIKGATDTDIYARQFISGHILFFLETGSSSDISAASSDEVSLVITKALSGAASSDNTLSGDTLSKTTSTDIEYIWIKDNTFQITITDAVAYQEYPCTIYWKWPQVFSEIILNEGDPYLIDRDPILNAELREDILDDMVENPQKYFYNSLTRAPLTTKDNLIKDILNIHDKSPDVGGTKGYDAQNFVDLSSFYNQADQIVGSRISFVILELSGEAGETVKNGEITATTETTETEKNGETTATTGTTEPEEQGDMGGAD